jgi:predicted GIY-YIG superfamily endonuclease
MIKTYYIYILGSQKKETLYIGVANDLWVRVEQHKKKSLIRV